MEKGQGRPEHGAQREQRHCHGAVAIFWAKKEIAKQSEPLRGPLPVNMLEESSLYYNRQGYKIVLWVLYWVKGFKALICKEKNFSKLFRCFEVILTTPYEKITLASKELAYLLPPKKIISLTLNYNLYWQTLVIFVISFHLNISKARKQGYRRSI